MYPLQVALALLAVGGTGEHGTALTHHPVFPLSGEVIAEPTSDLPGPWIQGDPADSLYRLARERLSQRDYRTAANLFAQLNRRFPRSGYAGDALYWQAFSLYRLGSERDLRDALAALRDQAKRFPQAATHGDAATLERRIQGELARRGDSEAAAQVTREASAAAQSSSASASSAEAIAPVPPVPPVPPTPPHPPSPPLGGRCADEDDMKVAALSALQQMDASRARPILQKLLARRDAESACLRRRAVFLIAQQHEPGTEDVLLESVRSDPDPEVKRQAVFWLSQVGTDRAVGALDSILRFSRDPEIQEKAMFALSQHNTPRAHQALRLFAERNEVPEETRQKAIFWLGQRQSAENAAFLRSLYNRLSSEELKKRVLFSLSQLGGEDNSRWLVGVARDTSQGIEMRKRALFWAGQGGAPLPIAELTRLYNTVSDREMRAQLIFVYSQRNEPAALDKLIEIARSDSNPELRKRALFWLGQSDQTRAIQAIQEILDQP
jgi:HEAT repeat protein